MTTSSFKELFGVRTKGDGLVEKIFFNGKHPALPTAFFSLVILSLSYYTLFVHAYSLGAFAGLFVAGVFLWTLMEYLLHRFVFHWESDKEPFKTIVAGLHLEHHQDPNNKFLIIASPMVALLLSGVLFGLLSLISGHLATAAAIMSGLYFAYVVYEWVHYGSHQYKWKSALGRYWTHNHLYHHFKKPKEAFGVTSPLWDHVFGTAKTL